MRYLPILALLFLLSACDRTAPKVAPPLPGDADKSKSEPPRKTGNALEDEIEAMTPVEPVNTAKLLAFLPAAPAGFTADKADGQSVTTDGPKYTVAGVDFRKGDGEVIVTLVDAARIKEKYRPILRWVGVDADETADDYTKGINLDGNPGWQGYDRKGRFGNMHVMIGKRYLLTIHLMRVDADVMHAVYKSIDVKGLAELK
jgi:hypothetical protein